MAALESMTKVVDHSETMERMLRTARTRFDSMTDENRETYLETARQLLPPSFQNDRDIVLITALDLYLLDEIKKGTLS